jgi:hypothetical protein
MGIEALKLEFLQRILKVQDEEVIRRLDMLLTHEEMKSPIPMTMDEFNQQIEEAEQDILAGRVTETSALLDEIKGWS